MSSVARHLVIFVLLRNMNYPDVNESLHYVQGDSGSFSRILWPLAVRYRSE